MIKFLTASPQPFGLPQRHEVVCHTTQISEQKCFVWQINNFDGVRSSPEIMRHMHVNFDMSSGMNSKSGKLEWSCSLKGERGNPIGLFLSLRLQTPDNVKGLQANVRCLIVDAQNKEHFNQTTTGNMDQFFENGRGFAEMIPPYPEPVPFLRDDGSLEIQLTVTVFHPTKEDSQLASLILCHENRFIKTLQSDLAQMRENPLENGSLPTKFVSRDGKEFPVNRGILSARSPVFRGMFQSGMSEGEIGLVEVKDLDSKSLSVILDFCHTGALSENWRNEDVIEGVVYGAHKYMLPDLKEFLGQALGLVCTANNCGKLVSVARTLGMPEAEKQLLEYFKRNLADNMEQLISFVEDAKKIATYFDEEQVCDNDQQRKKEG